MSEAVDTSTWIDLVDRLGVASAIIIALMAASGWILVRLLGKDGIAVRWIDNNISLMQTTEKSLLATAVAIENLDEKLDKIESNAKVCQDNHAQFVKVGSHACDLFSHLIKLGVVPPEVESHVTAIRSTLS